MIVAPGVIAGHDGRRLRSRVVVSVFGFNGTVENNRAWRDFVASGAEISSFQQPLYLLAGLLPGFPSTVAGAVR
jgi:hypothetical protein